ncbi:acetate--CoA ligase family protein [Yoonia litorea]|uniref:Acyl-CoA synthetase (NDP forming) n=1 Tax=Yoonia litorea TaxID=1123755 RepID=A0A1I6N193_9RHOB|nr:acetate--CoA ligase family protein [Yoonia litorea]SFS21558.1 Acyl-CoA synthetase (NDP forming) [Yoonia litorea]
MDRLGRLFRPKSIVVIGGGAWGEAVLRQCQKIGFAGDLWMVHPTKEDIAGLIPYRSIADLPHAPDAAYVAVNRLATIDVIRDLAAMGAGGAVCFASGFKEASAEDADGTNFQTALLEAAGDMPIIGPNCYGFLNYRDGVTLWPDQHGGKRVESGVALITQSSNVAINLTMQKRGLPIAYVVTVGNQAQTGLSEVGKSLLSDPKVTALGLYIEGIDDLAGFTELAHYAQSIGKPIVALKIGRSEQAQKAAVSHTASLAGSDAGADALLARLGVGRVRSLSALLESLKLLHVLGPLPSTAIASMSCSGGEASLMADTAHGTEISFPSLTDTQRQQLRATLGLLVALSNPLDYHTFIWGNEDAMAATFTAMMTPAVALGIVILDFPRPDRCTHPDWDLVCNAVARAQEASCQPVAILGSLVENIPEEVAERLITQGILPFCGLDEALEAITVAASLGRIAPDWTPAPPPVIRAGQTLTEAEAKAALSAHGIRTPTAIRTTRAILSEVAAQLTYPVVLKGEGITHKTEAGAVALNLATPEAVKNAAVAMPTDSFLLEEMITGTVAELLIGVVLDPAHGYVLTLAAGGTLTEILNDSVSLILPVSDDDIGRALAHLRIAPLLRGYRGASPANLQSIIDSVLALQDYVLTHHPYEVEINPLMCGSDHATAADALITTGEPDD